MHKHQGIDRRYRSKAAAAVGVLLLLAGCAGHKPVEPKNGAGAEVGANAGDMPGLASLLRAAEEQAKKPVAATLNAPPPPGIDAAVAQRIPSVAEGGDPKAWMPLADVIKELAAQDKPANPGTQERGEEAAEIALHHYVEGRQKLLDDDKEGAIAELRRATQLDPGAGQPWRELGEALLASGNRAEGIAAFQKAIATGLAEARIFETLGRDAQDRGDHAAAARLYARASLASPERADPFLPQVIDVALARSLAANGYTLAARDAMLRAARRPMQLSASTRYGSDFGAIFRRQGELWRQIGDDSCRLGQYAEALEAYEHSTELPSLDPQNPAPRMVFAAMRAGRPAAAAIAVLRGIVTGASGSADDDSVALLRYLAGQSRPLGQEMASALAQYQSTLKPPVAPSVAGSLARARAAVASPPAARALLREHLAQNPADLRTAADLFDALPDAKAAAAEAVLVVDSRPLAAGGMAEALLRSKAAYAEIEATLEKATPRPAARLIQAYLAAHRGEAGKAAGLSGEAPMTGRYAPAAALARIEMNLDAARTQHLDEPLNQLRSLQTPDGVRAYSRALMLMQRCKEALAVIGPVMDSPSNDGSQRLEDLIAGARLALSTGDGDRAEQWLTEAAALDPMDDRPDSGMLSLYGPSGPKADPAKLAQAAREIRQGGGSRTLRAARVKDLVRRSVFAQAELEAAQLADEDPSDTGLIDLLVSTWTRRTGDEKSAALERGKAWLGARLARRPLAPGLVAGMTTVLVAGGEAAQAESFLRKGLDDGGGPDLSRMLEHILRSELKRPQDADALALKRLSDRPLMPTEAIELAEVEIRQQHDADAVKFLRRAIPPEITLSDEQSARLLAIATELAQRAAERPDPARQAAAAEILDLASRRESKLPPDLHERRLVLLASLPDTDVDRLLEAAALTGKQYPVLSDKAYRLVSEALRQSKRSDTALAFISRAVQDSPSPSMELFAEWLQDIVVGGGVPNARQFIETAKSTGKLAELAARLQGGGEEQTGPAKDPRAEVAYAFGQYFASNQRNEEAMGAYELALEFDPRHAWASNNLGYSLADQGKDLDRAGRLLEQAHAALPNEAAITDSLGWLRYKQGILEDSRDPGTGAVKVRGAITLLQAAAMTDRGRRDPTILDHLGDAFWRANRRDEAQRYWELTENTAVQELRRSSARPAAAPGEQAPPSLSPAMVEEYRKLRDSAGAKRRAARAGGDVGVAPQYSATPPNVAPSPAPEGGAANKPPATPAQPGTTPAAQGAHPGPT